MQEIAFDRGEKESNTPLHPTMSAVERDWADLLPELVCIIARKVVDIFDFIRFRAVCKTWRSVTTIADLCPQFPWILRHNHGPDLNFYSMAFNKSFTIHAPKFSGTNFFYPCHGAMLVSSRTDFSWSMINPLNNSEVSLPLRHFCYDWIGPRNFHSRDYVVMKEFGNRLYVFKPGDEKWITMEAKDGNRYFYLNNLLFIVDEFQITEVVNLCTRETISVVLPPWHTPTLSDSELRSKLSCYPTLIESSGEILLVNYAHKCKKFEIHRLVFGNDKENSRWVEVTSIGDRMLFIDFCHRDSGFSLETTDSCRLNLKGNSIYLIRCHEKLSKCYAIDRYDIDSAETECINIQNGCIAWYLPDLNHI
ncbi:hypothetical protein LUZ63_015600 [Rhynchospora breviuscula]|uniref:KIB1-4 beta-propeller domain-containing protein n=1 Tax=Rhynchospora breviuscula TaxID=2022672 RepID=A0A9Q0CCY2_9POAL|nr:hypothetical protein LUZ63_015600 [Rhynchospora breviuscula]